MSKPKMIEEVKNITLVVLFLSTVLLLYFFWGNISFDQLKPTAAQTGGEVPDVISLIKPEQIVVNFGADNYTVLPPGDVWYTPTESDKDSFVKELGRFGPQENVLVKEISFDQYQQVMKLRSIRAEFSYDIPISDFCTYFGMKKPQSYDTIETVTEIGYSTAEEKSLFIRDGKNDKFYWLAADSEENDGANKMDFPGLISSIETKGYSIYYPVSSYLGGSVKNDTLVPLSVQANLKSFLFRQDFYSYQSEKINAMAEGFFGGNFDFVRKITEENGTIIYMYGYGQNVLIVNTDGSIEYKEEPTGGSSEQGFSGELETAVNYVAAHGSWESLDRARLTPYLKDVIRDPDKKKGYRFIFGMEVNGSRLFYETGDPIVVDVTSGQVTYYKRHMIDFDQKDIEAVETDASKDAFSAVNLIAQNFRYIYEILLQKGEAPATNDQAVMFNEIASMVKGMQIGYMKPSNMEAAEIRPVWAVTVNSTEIYFDLYSAEPVGYSRD